jgi:hypothetical protein
LKSEFFDSIDPWLTFNAQMLSCTTQPISVSDRKWRSYTLPCEESCGAAKNKPPLEPHFQPSGLNDFPGVALLQR